jgi:hypothetical protein
MGRKLVNYMYELQWIKTTSINKIIKNKNNMGKNCIECHTAIGNVLASYLMTQFPHKLKTLTNFVFCSNIRKTIPTITNTTCTVLSTIDT